MNFVLAVLLCAQAVCADDYVARAFYHDAPEAKLELLGKALDADPQCIAALRLRSSVLKSLGRNDEALADALAAARLLPNDFVVNYSAASIALELDKRDTAAECLERAVAADPQNEKARHIFTLVLLQLGRGEEAYAHADVLARRDPFDETRLALRADAAEAYGKYDDTIRDYSRIIETNPGDPRFLVQRAGAYRAKGELRNSLIDAERAVQVMGSSATYAARASTFEAMGELDKADVDYANAMQLDDDKRYFTLWRYFILRKQGNLDDAAKMITDFQLENEEWIAPIYHFLRGEISEERALELAKNDDPQKQREQLCEAYYYIGMQALTAGDLPKAEAYLRKTLEFNIYNFYEHGFAIRELRDLERRRTTQK